jgi:hypothetical protein
LPPLLIPLVFARVNPSFTKLDVVTYRAEPEDVATKARLLAEVRVFIICPHRHEQIAKRMIIAEIRDFIYFLL